MLLPFILAICLSGVFCLIPLTMYLLWLAAVTRRERPTVVLGPWDFAGVLFALSGFAVFGAGLVLTFVQANFRFWMRGNFEALRGAWVQERGSWVLLVGFYLTVLIGWAVLVLMARRRTLVIYNAEPAAVEALITEVFEQLNRPLERRGKLYVGADPLFELDTFEGGHTATLRWVSDDERLFEEVSRLLRAALASHASAENPAEAWVRSAAYGCGMVVVCCFGLLVYGLTLMAR